MRMRVHGAKRSPTIHNPRRALEEIVHHERYDGSKFRSEAELQDFMMKMSIRGTDYGFRWNTQGALLSPHRKRLGIWPTR